MDGDLAPTAQNLENLLLHRPPRELLEEKNIVHGPPGVDPSVQAARDELSRAQRRDVLAHQLRARPSPEDLRDRGWLPGLPFFTPFYFSLSLSFLSFSLSFPSFGISDLSLSKICVSTECRTVYLTVSMSIR